jgi:hypothetical protein
MMSDLRASPPMHDEPLRRCGIKVREILMMIGTPQKPGRGVPLTQHIGP